MLYIIEERTRNETYATDHEDNALRFIRAYRMKHPGHVVELWRQKLDGTMERMEA